MAGKDEKLSIKVCLFIHACLCLFAVKGESTAKVTCPSIESCTHQGRSKCHDPTEGCGPCITPYFEDGNTCRRHTSHEKTHNLKEQTGVPEIDVIVRRAEQTRRSNGDSTTGSTRQGEVVVDKTETRVKTDHQVVEPNGETTHLEHENVDTVEKTKPVPVVLAADDPSAGDPPPPAAPPAQDQVGAAVRSDDQSGTGGGQSDVMKEQGPPIAREGEILLEDWQFILIVCGCVAVGVLGIAVAFLCWYKIQTTAKAQSEAEYPAYGLTGPSAHMPSNMSNGDRKLAQSAQMYHYQHQKQQMIAMEKREKGEMRPDASDYDSEENEDGDLTVYECPGLAPTGEMQVKNPLFTEDRHSEPAPATEEKQ